MVGSSVDATTVKCFQHVAIEMLLAGFGAGKEVLFVCTMTYLSPCKLLYEISLHDDSMVTKAVLLASRAWLQHGL